MAARTYQTYACIWICGVEIERQCVIAWDYQPATGDGRHEPHFPESASVERVEIDGVDVTSALPKAFLNQLEAECLSQEREEREEREVEAAEERL